MLSVKLCIMDCAGASSDEEEVEITGGGRTSSLLIQYCTQMWQCQDYVHAVPSSVLETTSRT